MSGREGENVPEAKNYHPEEAEEHLREYIRKMEDESQSLRDLIETQRRQIIDLQEDNQKFREELVRIQNREGSE